MDINIKMNHRETKTAIEQGVLLRLVECAEEAEAVAAETTSVPVKASRGRGKKAAAQEEPTTQNASQPAADPAPVVPQAPATPQAQPTIPAPPVPSMPPVQPAPVTPAQTAPVAPPVAPPVQPVTMAPPTMPPVAQPPQITPDQIQRAGAELLSARPEMMTQLSALLQRFGVAAVDKLTPEMMGPFAVELRALGATI